MARIALNGMGHLGRDFLKVALTHPELDVVAVTREQVVSHDIVGDPHAAIVDLSLTKVVDGDLCSVYSWYDNELGYTHSLVDHVVAAARVSRPSAP